MKYYYDFHIHSCLSPCGDEDMTPNNIVNMALLNELDVIATTDHNCAKNAEAIMRCGDTAGILVIPGMEIECTEEFHIVALFRDLEGCMAMHDIVSAAMPPIANDINIFGRQVIMNADDEPVGEVENMLVTACSLSVDDVVREVRALGGVCIPAHIDRDSYSIISNLGYIPNELGFSCVELSKRADYPAMMQQYPYLDKYRIISSSDAHYLQDITERINALELEELTRDAVIDKLLCEQ